MWPSWMLFVTLVFFQTMISPNVCCEKDLLWCKMQPAKCAVNHAVKRPLPMCSVTVAGEIPFSPEVKHTFKLHRSIAGGQDTDCIILCSARTICPLKKKCNNNNALNHTEPMGGAILAWDSGCRRNEFKIDHLHNTTPIEMIQSWLEISKVSL